MRKPYAFLMMTLDGFYEGPNQEFHFWQVDDEFDEYSVGQLNDTTCWCWGGSPTRGRDLLRLIALQACPRRRNISALAADSTIEPTRQYRTLVVGPPQLDLYQTRVQQIESIQEALDLRPGAGYKRSSGQLI